jgi:uncharacterized RDD family membrane protein YckC
MLTTMATDALTEKDMTDPRTADRFLYDPIAEPDLYDGVLAKRVVGFFIDAFVVVVLMIPAALMVFLLGFITLGLAWLVFPVLFAIVGLAYIALTLGGPMSATVGQRFAGVEFRTWSGQRMFPLLAVMHALAFWFSVGLLTPLVLLVGLLTYRKQLLHDLLLGVVALNAHALHRREKPIVE